MQASKKGDNLKTLFSQVNLNNLVFQKRERKSVNSFVAPVGGTKKIHKRLNEAHKRPGRKKKVYVEPFLQDTKDLSNHVSRP